MSAHQPAEVMVTLHRRSVVALVLVPIIVLSLTFGASFKVALDASHEATNQAAKQKSLIVCVSQWADATTGRSSILTPLSNNRLNRLDALIRTVTLGKRAPFERALHAYIKASDAYKKAARDNPVPLAPKLVC